MASYQDDKVRSRANIRLALILGGVAVAFFMFGIWRITEWAAQ